MIYLSLSCKNKNWPIKLNWSQIEALLRRINEENKKTKEVLETIQRNELRKELKVIQKLAVSPSSILGHQEKTTTTFLDSLQTTLNLTLHNNNNNNNNNLNNNNNIANAKDKNGNLKSSSPLKSNKSSISEDFPLVTWETSG